MKTKQEKQIKDIAKTLTKKGMTNENFDIPSAKKLIPIPLIHKLLDVFGDEIKEALIETGKNILEKVVDKVEDVVENAGEKIGDLVESISNDDEADEEHTNKISILISDFLVLTESHMELFERVVKLEKSNKSIKSELTTVKKNLKELKK